MPGCRHHRSHRAFDQGERNTSGATQDQGIQDAWQIFDVLLLVYNYLKRDMGQRILRACREKNIGTTLMKTDPFGGGAFSYFNDIYTEQEKQGREAPGWIKILREKNKRQRELALKRQ